MFDIHLIRTLVLSAGFALVPIVVHAAPPPLPKGLDSDCLQEELRNCHITASGKLSLYDEIAIAFQVQGGHSDEAGVGAGVVLLEARDGDWVHLASDFTGVRYETPRLVDGDQMILHVPGFMLGTGSFNADLLFVRDYDSPDWRQIDIQSWRDEIGSLLPEGLEIWKGVDFDFGDWFWSEFNARTPLWQQSDANCCPTGGWAEIEFEIEDGRLVPTRVHYRPFDEDE